jgi:hypothetical protein
MRRARAALAMAAALCWLDAAGWAQARGSSPVASTASASPAVAPPAAAPATSAEAASAPAAEPPASSLRPSSRPALTPPVRPSSLPPLAPGEPGLPDPPAPAHLDDLSHLRLPPIVVQQDPVRDSRSLVWIGGLMVLAAVFLWNRNRRFELERLEAASSAAAARAAGASRAAAAVTADRSDPEAVSAEPPTSATSQAVPRRPNDE